jgi:hypothetical protein
MTGAVLPAPVEPPSDAILRTAAEARLGNAKSATFRPKFIPRSSLKPTLILMSGLILVTAIVFIFANTMLEKFVAGVFLFLWVLSAIISSLKALDRTLPTIQLVLFEQGFVYSKKNTAVAVRWEGIDRIYRSITDHYTNGRYKTTTYRYTITWQNEKLILRDNWPYVPRIGNHITDEVTRVRLPLAIQEVQGGGKVSFGDLEVTAAGISNKRHGFIPWTDIEEVQVKKGYVKIRRAGKWLPWSSMAAASIPNLFVFLSLAEGLSRSPST